MRRSSKKLPSDPNKRAAEIVRLSTEEEESPPQEPSKEILSKYFAEIGRKGGKKGGKARAERLTPEERSKIAKKAAKARWSKKR